MSNPDLLPVALSPEIGAVRLADCSIPFTIHLETPTLRIRSRVVRDKAAAILLHTYIIPDGLIAQEEGTVCLRSKT